MGLPELPEPSFLNGWVAAALIFLLHGAHPFAAAWLGMCVSMAGFVFTHTVLEDL